MTLYVPALRPVPVLLAFVPGTAAAATGPAPSPDPTHPVVMQQAAGQMSRSASSSLAPFTPVAPQAAVGGAGGPIREIFGFGLASSLAHPTVRYPSWNLSLLSTVAFFGLHVQGNGTFAADQGASVWNSSQLSGLLSTAHSHGTKVVRTTVLQA